MKLTFSMILMLVSLLIPSVIFAQEGETEATVTPEPEALATEAESAPENPLLGVVWELVSYGDVEVLAENPIHLIFMPEQFVGSSGCNSYNGGYALDGDQLELADNLITTLMACTDDALMAQEQAYLALLAEAVRYELDDDGHLVLHTAADEQLIFNQGVTLEDTTWTFTGLITPDDFVVALQTTEITLRFDAGTGTIGGFGGCNSYGGTYTLDGELIDFSEVFTTEMACMEDGIMEQEAAFHDALSRVTHYLLSKNLLRLYYSDAEGTQNSWLTFEVKEQTVDLANTGWQLVHYGNPAARQSVAGDDALTLVFDGDNKLRGYGGCNNFGSTYTADADGNLQIEQAFSTRRACMQRELMTQEMSYLTALSTATHYTLTADELTIYYGEDGEELTFTYNAETIEDLE